MSEIREDIRDGERAVENLDQLRQELYEKIQGYDFERVVAAGSGSSLNAARLMDQALAETGLYSRSEPSSRVVSDPEILTAEDLFVCISQSGETTETLEALRAAEKSGARTLAVTNHPGSSIGSEADLTVPTRAGEENADVSTKFVDAAFGVALMLSDCLEESQDRHDFNIGSEGDLTEASRALERAESVFVLGMGKYRALAHEGANKIEECARIHATAANSMEFKHGSIALADGGAVVVLALNENRQKLYDTFLRDIEKSEAESIVIASDQVELSSSPDHELEADPNPISGLKVLQRLAVRTAEEKGVDPSSPPNIDDHVEKPNLDQEGEKG